MEITYHLYSQGCVHSDGKRFMQKKKKIPQMYFFMLIMDFNYEHGNIPNRILTYEVIW